jgi:hypothetical protein
MTLFTRNIDKPVGNPGRLQKEKGNLGCPDKKCAGGESKIDPRCHAKVIRTA